MVNTVPRILADENIALVQEAFAGLGELHTAPGRAITPDQLRDVDILLVRSVTRVDAALLQHSRCRFVGTATSGTDHVDRAWLAAQGIAFADAHGCNADAVVDYVLAALAHLAMRDGVDWTACTFGIIGCGAVGGRLAKRLLALGLVPRIHDPFLTQAHPLATYFTSLEDALAQQVTSLHVPLTFDGPHPTWQLLGRQELGWLRPDAILVNAARGQVLDTTALLRHMDAHPALRVVLDAWEGEPAVSRELLARVDLGTPHIAGYSRLGKVRGTLLLRDALRQHLDLPAASPLSSEDQQLLHMPPSDAGPLWQWLARCLLAAYDPASDHAAMQALLSLDAGSAAQEFDRLRKHYPERPEFSQFRVHKEVRAAAALQALGFAAGPAGG